MTGSPQGTTQSATALRSRCGIAFHAPTLSYSVCMSEPTFDITQEADGGFVAQALGENIVTQADTWVQLRENVLEAVALYFDKLPKPSSIRLHLRKDEVLALA